MKKLGIICMMAVMAAIGMVSCQESAGKQDQAIAYKIENNEELTSEDYSHMIAYVGEYAEKAQKYVDMQINDENSAEANAGMEKLAEEYPMVDTFRNCLRITPLNKLSQDNLDQMSKYAGLIEFSVPAGFEIQTNDEAAGLEVATPDSANGVIAGAVDTLKVER